MYDETQTRGDGWNCVIANSILDKEGGGKLVIYDTYEKEYLTQVLFPRLPAKIYIRLTDNYQVFVEQFGTNEFIYLSILIRIYSL